ncbi:hypothetical protein R6Z07F_010774 [Ovis aries]
MAPPIPRAPAVAAPLARPLGPLTPRSLDRAPRRARAPPAAPRARPRADSKAEQSGCRGRRAGGVLPGLSSPRPVGPGCCRPLSPRWRPGPGQPPAAARALAEPHRRGDFSPAARAGARCEYILCLPVLPSSVAKVNRYEQIPGGGGQKGGGVRRAT